MAFLIGSSVCGQSNNHQKQMIAKIDSISDARNVKLGIIKAPLITNRFDNTTTEQNNLTKTGYFHFDGNFLVMDDKYFNIDKLLYFYIKQGVFEFYFQGY